MGDGCPVCGKPYGKRKRCYACSPGPKRTGIERSCLVCGKTLYVPQWVARDVDRRSGSYCSRACKHQAQREIQPPPKWARLDQPIRHSAGYVLIYAPSHPRANAGGRVLEHILVAEQTLGRPLTTDDHVHHIDGDKTNNSPDNLLVLSNSEHQKLHAAMMRSKKKRT